MFDKKILKKRHKDLVVDTKSTSITFRASSELRAKLERIADEHSLSMSMLICEFLHQAVARYEADDLRQPEQLQTTEHEEKQTYIRVRQQSDSEVIECKFETLKRLKWDKYMFGHYYPCGYISIDNADIKVYVFSKDNEKEIYGLIKKEAGAYPSNEFEQRANIEK